MDRKVKMLTAPYIYEISRCDLYSAINRKTWAFYNTYVESFMASLTMSGIRRTMTST